MVKLKKFKKIVLFCIGVILLVVGLIIISIKKYKNYQNKLFEKVMLNNFYIKSVDEKSSLKIDNKLEEKIEYIAIINIPKIDLEKGLFSIESPLNNVDINIQILKDSDMPDIENGNLILAAHSGNSNVSYFKYLDKLAYNDLIYIDYNNTRYTYKVANFYTIEKNGKAEIIRDFSKRTLTLITCVENTNRQLVIICELS